MQMKNHTHIHRVYIITGNWRAIYECGYVCDNQENFLFHLILVLNQNFPQIYPFSSTICTTSISQNPFFECTQVRAHTHKYSYGGQDFTMLQKKGTKLIKAGLKTFNSHCQLCFCDSRQCCYLLWNVTMCCTLCDQENVVRDFELNEVYGQCKKNPLPSRRKDKDVTEAKKENWWKKKKSGIQDLHVFVHNICGTFLSWLCSDIKMITNSASLCK